MNNDTLFALAQQSLLAPYALEARHLQQVFGKMLVHQLDYADLYFQCVRRKQGLLRKGKQGVVLHGN